MADTCGTKIPDNGVGCLVDSDCADNGAICIDLVNKDTGLANSPDG